MSWFYAQRSFLVGAAILSFVTLADCKKRVESLSIGVKYRSPECSTYVKHGDTISIHYTGYLYESGEEFDSSIPRGDPLVFKLGSGSVIQGWEKGLIGMCLGDVRRLTIPAQLGYGSYGAPPKVPPDADLRFEIELLNIERHQEL